MSKNKIVEKPDNNPIRQESSSEYDYVVSEAAVGQIEGVQFTVAEITEELVEGKTKNTTYLDIEKKRFEDIYEGSVVSLNEKVKVLVVKIESLPTPQGKGKVYFKVVD